jgi:hypothetical protein
MAGGACLQEAGQKDFSFLGNRIADEPCRHGMAVLESYGEVRRELGFTLFPIRKSHRRRS